jgi:thiol-disulfide isomerase/thioredoxin
MILGGLGVLFVVLASTQGEPKAWENDRTEYLTGEMAAFERTIPPQPLPNLRLRTLEGQEAARLPRLVDGRVVVVNLWATWCAPCLEELPTLAALEEMMPEQVQVVTVAMESGEGTRQLQLLDKLDARTATMLQDPRLGLMQSFGGDLQLPLTVVYDPRGREIGRLAGSADWAAPESRRLLAAVAGGTYPG